METADGELEMAYRETLVALGAQVREARVDHEALERPLRACDLARCRATCCHDGVVLGSEEADEIRRVVAAHAEVLGRYAWTGDADEVVVEEAGVLRTARRTAEDGELAEDFPDHFPRTRCVLLDSGHRCVLQRLAIEQGKHPWFWKPVSCWMHPVLVKSDRPGGRPVLTVLGPREDQWRFASCTHCGREERGGARAAVVLGDELEMLGKLGGRNLLGEVG